MAHKPATGQKQPSLKKILDAIQKCRDGKITPAVGETLHDARLLRAAFHGSPRSLQCVYINFDIANSREAVRLFRKPGFLPEHASLRFVAGTFGIDAIISGEFSREWFTTEIGTDMDYGRFILDYLQMSYSRVMRHRWRPCEEGSSVLQPLLKPSVADVQNFLKENKSLTRLIYDITALPIFSCVALITCTAHYPDKIWELLGEYDKPIRDLYHNGDLTEKKSGGLINKWAVNAPYLAFCEFDNFVNGEKQLDIVSAMNRAYDWLTAVMNRPGITSVALIPCVALKDSYDILDDVGRLRDFKPAVKLRSINPDDVNKKKIVPFPVWTYLICGGRGGGKSVTTFYIMAELLEGSPAHDVIFVNYKFGDSREDLGEKPTQPSEVYDFVRVICERTGKKTTLVRPEELEQTLTRANNAGAYYTEGHKNITVKQILETIMSACERNKRNGSMRSCVIVFDEILNQDEKDSNMEAVFATIDQTRTLNLYTGVIGQGLTRIWQAKNAESYAQSSSVIVAGPLDEQDIKHFNSLWERAQGDPELYKTTAAKLGEVKRGEFILLPRNATKSEQPVLIKTESVRLRPEEEKKSRPLDADWVWGASVEDII